MADVTHQIAQMCGWMGRRRAVFERMESFIRCLRLLIRKKQKRRDVLNTSLKHT